MEALAVSSSKGQMTECGAGAEIATQTTPADDGFIQRRNTRKSVCQATQWQTPQSTALSARPR